MRGTGSKDSHVDLGQEKENVGHEEFFLLKFLNRTLEELCINVPAS